MNTPNSLVGRWVRTSRDVCGDTYAWALEFLSNGTYRGTPAIAGGFTIWDVGTYRITGPGTIALSTANDAVITYGFVLREHQLTLTDEHGCVLTYVPEAADAP